MKKLITFMMSLLIMTTMMSTGIYADDTSDVDINGGSQNVDVSTTENISYEAATDDEVYKVTVSWSTTPAVYDRTDKLVWNPDTLNYDVFREENIGDAETIDASATITITNYSNREIDYGIFFTPKKVNETDITSEAPTTSETDIPHGTIASADSTGEIQSGTNTNASNSAVYHGTISYTDGYVASDTTNTEMGSYAVKISKHLTLNKTGMTIKNGRTYTSVKASVPVTWSSSNEKIATVDENGKVTAIGDGSVQFVDIIATSKATGVTAACKVCVRSSGSYFLHDSQEDFDLLLSTPESEIINYTEPDGNIVYAYNGFVKETSGANWDKAQSFVKALNDNNIKPAITAQGTEGTWRLFESYADAQAWAVETKTEISDGSSGYAFANYSTVFGGVDLLWSSVESNSDYGFTILCNNGDWRGNIKLLSYPNYGYVVIWQPDN